MNAISEVIRLLRPFYKGWPIPLICLAISLFAAKRMVLYSIPMYESTAKLKLDDNSIGFSNTNLYKDLDVFSSNHKIAVEVEVLKSESLLVKAIDGLNFNPVLKRTGKLKTTELFEDKPFNIFYHSERNALLDKVIRIEVKNEEEYKLSYVHNHDTTIIEARFGEIIDTEELNLSLEINEKLKKQKDNKLDILGNYELTQYEPLSYVKKVIKPNLSIKAIEKDVPVIRLSYKSSIPEMSSQLVNKLAKVYIQDYISTKTKAAEQTGEFIEKQVTDVHQKLKKAELAIEEYKLTNNIINTKQQSETELRKIAQLEIQLNNLEMKEKAILLLNSNIQNDNSDYIQLPPGFETFGDMLFVELIKKLNDLRSERRKLLSKYLPRHQEIQDLNANIEEILIYIRTSINNATNDISLRRQEISNSIARAKVELKPQPTKEKILTQLERDFNMHQSLYNFLTQKKTESDIAQSAAIAFHKLLSEATVPKAPISPNKTLIYFVFGFLGLFTGIALVFLFSALTSKIIDRFEVEKLSTIPVIGNLPKKGKKEAAYLRSISALAANLQLSLINKKEGKIISVNSALNGEGKTMTSFNLANTLALMGNKVLLIDFNLYSPTISKKLNLINEQGLAELLNHEDSLFNNFIYKTQTPNLFGLGAGINKANPGIYPTHRNLPSILAKLKADFEWIIIDTPAASLAFDAVPLMQKSDISLFIIRSNFSNSKAVQLADIIQEDYKIDNLKLVLNGSPVSTNYNGTFKINSRKLETKKRGWLSKAAV